MLTDFLGQFHVSAPSSRIAETFMWKWAFEHPYLHAFIEVSHSYYFVALVIVAGVGIVRRMFRKV